MQFYQSEGCANALTLLADTELVLACSGGSLCHGLLGLFDQFVKGFQQLIGAVLADDVFQLLVQIVAELVQSGDLFQRGHVLIVDDLVDLVGHIRDQLGQFFVQDGVPQLFQGAGNIKLLDHVLVLFDHILELVQLFLISTVFQRLFQLVLDAVDIGLFDLFQCFAELIRHIRSIGAQFINGFLRLIERLVDLGQIAVLDGFLQGVQRLVGGSFLQVFFCVLDDRVHSVLQDGVFLDLVDQIPGLLDQFLQLLMPWQALYYHDGESAPCTKFISVYNYSGLNIGGKSYFNTPTHPHVAHRDSRGRNVAYEHTEFTSGKEIRQAAANAGIGLSHDYDTTFFRFADYRTGAENTMRGTASGRTIRIVHSDNYKTSFSYSALSRTYKMQMYSHAAGGFENTVDELNGKQLSFDNLLICFAPIAAYPGDSGDVQQVSYISGGEAYFFSRGGVQVGRWEKASPEHPLKVYDDAGAELLFNRGKTYLAIVDDDEWSNFSYQ